MKYLLACPSCGATIPVRTGQAGQRVQCICGKTLDVPSIRALQKLASMPEEQPASRTWSRRQGLAFLGFAIFILAIIGAVCILLFRPAPVDAREFSVPVDTRAISKEVDTYSPAEGFRRFEMIEVPLPSLAESLKSGQVPVHLLPSAGMLIAFEGKGTEALAPDEAKNVLQELAKVSNAAFERQSARAATSDWLWVLAAVGMFGLGLAGSTLLVRPGPKAGAAASARVRH
ncbi:MAG TPA: hypothetical protein VGI75_06670 [Pirellulales bacterium]